MQTCHVLSMFALDWATETVHLKPFLYHSFSQMKDMYKTYSSQTDRQHIEREVRGADAVQKLQ